MNPETIAYAVIAFIPAAFIIWALGYWKGMRDQKKISDSDMAELVEHSKNKIREIATGR